MSTDTEGPYSLDRDDRSAREKIAAGDAVHPEPEVVPVDRYPGLRTLRDVGYEISEVRAGNTGGRVPHLSALITHPGNAQQVRLWDDPTGDRLQFLVQAMEVPDRPTVIMRSGGFLEIDVTAEFMTLFDLVADSMDAGSGMLSTEQEALLEKVALEMGFLGGMQFAGATAKMEREKAREVAREAEEAHPGA